jgi:hypothetical protein
MLKYQRGSTKCGSLARGRAEIQFRTELVEDGFLQSCQDGLRGAEQVQNHHLVPAFVQPWPWQVCGLRWADIPISAQTMALTQIGVRSAYLFSFRARRYCASSQPQSS